MQFPEGRNFVAAAREPNWMRLISECSAHNLDCQRRREFLIQDGKSDASML